MISAFEFNINIFIDYICVDDVVQDNDCQAMSRVLGFIFSRKSEQEPTLISPQGFIPKFSKSKEEGSRETTFECQLPPTCQLAGENKRVSGLRKYT